MTQDSLLYRTSIWPATLGLATVLGSFALACVFPFAAFAALAALTLSVRSGLLLIAAVWLTNQLVGFFLLSFPWDAQAAGHGISLLLTTGAAFASARWLSIRVGNNPLIKAGSALAIAFIVYEVLLLVYAQIGGGAENFTPAIVADIARNDAIWFAALMALRYALTRVTSEAALPQTA
jgi:hypothetical protein